MPLFIHLESNPQVVWADCGGGRCYEGLVLRCESVRERGSLLQGGSLLLMWERAMPVQGLCSGAGPFASAARSYRWQVKPQRCVSCLYSCGRRNGSCCGSLIRV